RAASSTLTDPSDAGCSVHVRSGSRVVRQSSDGRYHREADAESARLPSAEPGRSKSYQQPVETTRYPNERTWSVASYLSPIAVRSRTSCIAAPLDAQDMPNRASTDAVVRNLPLVA